MGTEPTIAVHEGAGAKSRRLSRVSDRHSLQRALHEAMGRRADSRLEPGLRADASVTAYLVRARMVQLGYLTEGPGEAFFPQPSASAPDHTTTSPEGKQMSKARITNEQLARMLEVVKNPSANPARLKTAFLSVVGQPITAAGWTVEDLREALTDYQSMGGDEAPAAAAPEPDITPAKAAAARQPAARGRTAPQGEAPKGGRTPAQIAATERMRTANAAKAAASAGDKGKGKTGGKAPAAAKKAPTPRAPKAPVITDPKKILAAKKAESPALWEKVVEVVEVSDKGNPLRVVIRCKDPDTGEFISGKAGLREIAVQDLFQVHYTIEGAKRARALKRSASRAETATPARKAASAGKASGSAKGGKTPPAGRKPASRGK